MNTEITIRRASPSDAIAIAGLINECFDLERTYVDDELETEGSVTSALSNGGCLVATDAVGLLGCVYVDLGRRIFCKLAVAPARRLTGIGRRLMAEAERLGREAGWTIFTIGVLSFRTELFEIYSKLGYVQTRRRGEIRSRVIQPCFIVVMTKPAA